MRWTRASIEEDAKANDLEPVKVDGIPEGFLWKEADVTINEVEHKGKFVLYGPLGKDIAKADTVETLLQVYNSITKKESHPMNHAKENLERTRGEAKDKKGN